MLNRINMEQLKILQAPDSAYYSSNFISEEKEKFLLHKIYQAPIPKWTVLSNRRLQNWGGFPHPKGMVQEDIPEWLQECNGTISELGIFDTHIPNHVLINEYKPGQGIMPHLDGPLYFPCVATVSLGCQTLLDFYRPTLSKNDSPYKYEFSFLLERRSLLVLKDSMYNVLLHGISENEEDQIRLNNVKNVDLLGCEILRSKIQENVLTKLTRDATRISLTYRNVPKTKKFKLTT